MYNERNIIFTFLISSLLVFCQLKSFLFIEIKVHKTLRRHTSTFLQIKELPLRDAYLDMGLQARSQYEFEMSYDRLIRLNPPVVFLRPKANSEVVVSFYPPRASQHHLQIFCLQAGSQALLHLYRKAANGIKNSIKLKIQPKCSSSFHCGVLKQSTFHYVTFFAPVAELASSLPLSEGRATLSGNPQSFKYF
jgi:hypothetical protein